MCYNGVHPLLMQAVLVTTSSPPCTLWSPHGDDHYETVALRAPYEYIAWARSLCLFLTRDATQTPNKQSSEFSECVVMVSHTPPAKPNTS